MRRKVAFGIMLTWMLASMLILVYHAQPAKAWIGGPISIHADGSVSPPDAPIHSFDNVTYTLTDNIIATGPSDGMSVSRDNIVIDGAGYTLQGSSVMVRGIRFSGRTNVTIMNINIRDWLFGLVIGGTFLKVSGNNITGIRRDGILIEGQSNMICKNTIEGAPGDSYGIQHSEDFNATVYGNTIRYFWYGIMLTYSSSNNTIYDNTLTDNTCGIGTRETGASHNIIRHNTITRNYGGIDLYNSANYNIVTENNVSANNPALNRGSGIGCRTASSNNIISRNVIRANGYEAIYLEYSSQNNSVIENLVEGNRYGVLVAWASNNEIYHNSFVGNQEQVHDKGWDQGQISSTNVWDDGYPSGGNYWSDYTGVDQYSGPSQDEPGSDGIGDTPYIIDQSNRDRYPFTSPWRPPIDWWPMLQHDLQHIGFSTSKLPNNLLSIWNFSDRADAYCSAPVTYNETVFVNIYGQGGGNGILWALNETNGAPLWSFPMGAMTFNSPAIFENKIFAGGIDGKFYCLNLNGDLVWNFTCEYNDYIHGISPIYSSPSFGYGKVYLLSYGGYLHALNLTNGQVIWAYRTGSATLEQSSPAVWNGMIYFGSVDSLFYALNATDGSLVWQFNTDYSIVSPPTIIEGRVYIGSGDSRFYCLNATDGSLSWQFTAGGPILHGAASLGGKVFFTDRQGWAGESSKLYTLKASDGTLLWNTTIDIRVRTSPTIADGKVFVGAPAYNAAHFYAFNLTNGEQVWHYVTAFLPRWSTVGCSFAISNSRLFVGSEKVYAFGERTSLTFSANVDIDPDTLNLKSIGNWITAYIELQEGHDVSDIDVSSIRLNDTFTVDPEAPSQIGDYDSDGILDLMVKFNRTELTSYLYNVLGIKIGNATLVVSGQLIDDSRFEGMDVIRVIFAGDANNDSKVDTFDLYTVGKYYGARIGEPDYLPEADLNSDGVIDGPDLLIMNINYGGAIP